jgi:hypothetical protein
MRTHRFAAVATGLCLAVPTAAGAANRPQAGLWEVTATVELPGVKSPAPTTQTECLSQSDVEADPAPGLQQGACRATDVRRSGDKVTWKLDCGDIGKGEGEVVYQSPTSYEGWMRLETMGTAVRTTIHARRLDKC